MQKRTKYVILGLLRDEAMTGYEIKKCIDQRMSFFWQESYGQIYPELNSLLAGGMIAEEPVQTGETNRRGKIKYRITPSGIEAFNRWMKEDNEKDTVRSEALLKFSLATGVNDDDLIKHLETFYQRNKERLNLYLAFEKNLKEFIRVHENHRYILEVLSLGIKQQELYCSWSEEYKKRLEEKK